MRNLLVPDFNATQDVDPELLRLDFEISRYESMVESASGEDDETAKRLAELVTGMQEDRDTYAADDGPKFSVTIGYIPPAKKTEIRNKTIALSRLEDFAAISNAHADLDRDVVRFGLRGWNMESPDGPIPFESETVKVAGLEVPTASPLMVSIVEYREWLAALAREILEYNSLSTEEKKRSL